MRILFLLFASIGMAIRGQRRKKRQEEQFQQQQQLQQQQFHHEQMMQQQQFQQQLQQQQFMQQQMQHQHGSRQRYQQQQDFQQQQPHFQQPLLQNRDMNGSPMPVSTPNPLHYNSQLPSQYSNVSVPDVNAADNRTSMHGIHRVPVPHQPVPIQTQQLQYGSDVKHAPEMVFMGGYDAQPPQYVQA
ncbi:hypothetical protein Sste5346_005529 [Sporothrix stenoceras]|uniref:Uncharacterized protein n=1 Tax=Sporothrix stenoceras TaxID=5173 RepID=A0ABR3Z3L1_9PEZI